VELYHETAQDSRGNILNGATITVYDAGTSDLATIFDKDGGSLDNPFLSGYERSSGEVDFAAADGLYDIKVSGDTDTVIEGISLTDGGGIAAMAAAIAVRLVTTNNLSDLGDAAAALANLGFTFPILSRKAAGDIGETTPAAVNLTIATSKAYDAGNLTGAKTLGVANGDLQYGTTTGNTTWTFSGAAAAGRVSSVTLELTNGGAFAQTWPASVDWAGGEAPTLTAAGVDVLTFITRNNGATWFGFLAGADMK